MLFALSMGEIRTFVDVEGETKSTFESSQMCSKDIGVLIFDHQQWFRPRNRLSES